MREGVREVSNKNSNIGFLLILLIIGGVLIITNPTKSVFVEFVDNELVKTKSYLVQKENYIIDTLMNDLGRKIISENIKANSYRDSYMFFSVFTIRNKGKDYKFIGVLNMIFPHLNSIDINKFSY